MNKTTYIYSLNYNLGDVNVIETRSLKRVIVNDTTKVTQIIKAKMKEHSMNEIDKDVLEKLGSKPYLILEDEILADQFENFVDKSFDLFSVDLTKLNLH